jgi:Zn-dependent protease with chaperone function
VSTDEGRRLQVEYFDGRSPLARPATLQLDGRNLVISGAGFERRMAWHQVQWPERQRHGLRVALLDGGGSVQARDAAAWDAFMRGVHGEPWIVRWQQSWRATLGAVLALIALAAAGYQWGVPLTARAVGARLPAAADQATGEAVLGIIERDWLAPSALPPARQEALRRQFEQAIRAAARAGAFPAMSLQFRKSRIGPNAFALPGGTIVVTDELVQLADGRDELLLGVLAHEAGHVLHRHGMRMVVQATLITAASGVALGDFSSLLATAPALLGQLGYSRDFEREADRVALQVLEANGRDGSTMVSFFERIEAWEREHVGVNLPAFLSSHPIHADRKAFFGGRPAAATRR